MTSKDYELIAGVLREAHEDIARAYGDRWDVMHHVVDDVTSRLADALGYDNPRFDRQRFIAATSWQDADAEPSTHPTDDPRYARGMH